jgi:hypothetical protein
VDQEAWPDSPDDLAALLARLGETVDILRHRLPDVGDLAHERKTILNKCL